MNVFEVDSGSSGHSCVTSGCDEELIVRYLGSVLEDNLLVSPIDAGGFRVKPIINTKFLKEFFAPQSELGAGGGGSSLGQDGPVVGQDTLIGDNCDLTSVI